MQEAEACRGTEHSRILNDVVTHAPFSLQLGLGYTRVLGHQYLYIRVFIRIRVYMD